MSSRILIKHPMVVAMLCIRHCTCLHYKRNFEQNSPSNCCSSSGGRKKCLLITTKLHGRELEGTNWVGTLNQRQTQRISIITITPAVALWESRLIFKYQILHTQICTCWSLHAWKRVSLNIFIWFLEILCTNQFISWIGEQLYNTQRMVYSEAKSCKVKLFSTP